MQLTPHMVTRIGWLASSMAVAMYTAYIDQIVLNLQGHKGSVLLPCMTVANCVLWCVYGWYSKPKQWPIVVCNIPGVVLGLITFVTAWY